MPLEKIAQITAEEVEPLPAAVAEFLGVADERVQAYFGRRRDRSLAGFIPSDYPTVYQALVRCRSLGFDPGLFLEWGAGFGVVAGIAALLGHDAYGIELDPALAEHARSLLEDQGIEAPIVTGSYVPDDFDETGADPEFLSVAPGTPAYDDLGLTIAEFDAIFVFPWPGTETMHFELFDRFASLGALLLSHHGVDGTIVHRKAAAPFEVAGRDPVV